MYTGNTNISFQNNNLVDLQDLILNSCLEVNKFNLRIAKTELTVLVFGKGWLLMVTLIWMYLSIMRNDVHVVCDVDHSYVQAQSLRRTCTMSCAYKEVRFSSKVVGCMICLACDIGSLRAMYLT